MIIVILGKEYRSKLGHNRRPYIVGLHKCPCCDAEGTLYFYFKDGDCYGVCCGFHIGTPKE